MTERVERNLANYCARLLMEHEIQIGVSDPVLPALYVIHKEMKKSAQKNQAIADSIQEASKKFNPKQFIFNNGDAAEEFQRGITRRWGIVGLILLLFTWGADWYRSMSNEIVEAKNILDSSGNLRALLQSARMAKTGEFYIDFIAPKGDSARRFVEYKRVNSKTVRVYLGKKPQ